MVFCKLPSCHRRDRSRLCRRPAPRLLVWLLRRTLLRLTNTLLALLGLAMLGYAVYTYIK